MNDTQGEDLVGENGSLIHQRRVPPEWIDYNGHMNLAYYTLAFCEAFDGYFEELGVGPGYAASGQSFFALESHHTYLKEAVLNDPLNIVVQLLDLDQKRVRMFMRMIHGETGDVLATYEEISLHVDLETRRSAPLPADKHEKLKRIYDSHSHLELPEQAGHGIGMTRKQ